MLSQKLAIQTHETIELESRFRRMADLAPVGMFHIDTTGVLIYANEDYYRYDSCQFFFIRAKYIALSDSRNIQETSPIQCPGTTS